MKRFFLLIFLEVLVLTSGCARPWAGRLFGNPNLTVSPVLTPNPASVIITDHELAWNQIVDEVDDYFKIKREERIRIEEGIISEGIITTYPTPGSTILEPWKRDSTRGFEKLHATLHSVRRTCKVRVIPSGTAYLVEVTVIKEMEDIANPENSTAVDPIRSNVETRTNNDGEDFSNKKTRWFEMGRDTSLEQKILANIQARLQF